MPTTATTKAIDRQQTGIDALDHILGGGIPSGHVVLLSGCAGTGKTMLSMQWLFSGAEHHSQPGIYFTLTEPITEVMRNLSPLSFCKDALLPHVHVTDARTMLRLLNAQSKFDSEKAVDKIIASIKQLVEETGAKRLVIDSITALGYIINSENLLRYFIFRLRVTLSKLGCTTLLTSEKASPTSSFHVEEFISDGIVRFSIELWNQQLQHKLQVVKMRATSFFSGPVFFTLTKEGVTLFPPYQATLSHSASTDKVSVGVDAVDHLLGGGLLSGSTTFVAGATGTGKSLLCMHFIQKGVDIKEPSLYIGFEESKEQVMRNAREFGWKFDKKGKKYFHIHCKYPYEKSLAEHLEDIKQYFEKHKIKRCVIDSLSAIASCTSPDLFNTFSQQLFSFIKSRGITAIFTSTTPTLVGVTKISNHNLSTLADNIVILRYVEMSGELHKIIHIIKVRGSDHSKDLRRYDITSKGITIGNSVSGYEGIVSGSTRKVSSTIEEQLSSAFTTYIGPMGPHLLEQLKDQGLTTEHVLDFAKDLQKRKVMKAEEAESFIAQLQSIMSPHKGGDQ